MSWREYLHEGIVDWLISPENPSVRYWTLLQLLDRDVSNSIVQETQDAIMESKIVRTILQNQDVEGYWEEETDLYLPKYKATTHSLLILAEIGARITPDIQKGLEHVFRFQLYSGHLKMKMPKTERGRNSKLTDGCCYDGNILYYMIRFGYFEDPRVQKLVEFLLLDHDNLDAGWKCRAYPINPNAVFPVNCYMGAAKVFKAFSIIPERLRTPQINKLISMEVESLLDNGIYRYLRNADGSRKDKAGWKRFGFPLFYQSDVLEVLEALTRLGIRDERMQDSIDLVVKRQGMDGKWLLKNTYSGKMWMDFEEKHMPSKWITLKALTVLKRYL